MHLDHARLGFIYRFISVYKEKMDCNNNFETKSFDCRKKVVTLPSDSTLSLSVHNGRTNLALKYFCKIIIWNTDSLLDYQYFNYVFVVFTGGY